MKILQMTAGAIVLLALGAVRVGADAAEPKVIDVKVGTVADLDGDGRAVDPSGFAREPPAGRPAQNRPAAPAEPPVSGGRHCDDESRAADDCEQ